MSELKRMKFLFILAAETFMISGPVIQFYPDGVCWTGYNAAPLNWLFVMNGRNAKDIKVLALSALNYVNYLLHY